jgi:hypothetical protein
MNIFSNGHYEWERQSPQIYFLDLSESPDYFSLIIRGYSPISKDLFRLGTNTQNEEHADTIFEIFGYYGRIRGYDGIHVVTLRGYFHDGNFLYGYLRQTHMIENSIRKGSLSEKDLFRDERFEEYLKIEDFRRKIQSFFNYSESIDGFISRSYLPDFAKNGLRSLIDQNL